MREALIRAEDKLRLREKQKLKPLRRPLKHRHKTRMSQAKVKRAKATRKNDKEY